MHKNTDKTNENLRTARTNKADEFYTMYEDIEKEMSLYKKVLIGKVVYCPCDDYRYSNFYKFFKDKFKELGLKELIATSYGETGGTLAIVDEFSVREQLMDNTFDMMGQEVMSLIKNVDVIVTNPPFSRSGEFMAMLLKMGKDFIILGNMNALTYKGIFCNVVDGKLKYGGTIHSGDRKFYIPDDYPLDGTSCGVDSEGRRFIRVKGVRWFTTLDYEFHEMKKTVLTKKFNPDDYPKYDTYDAINVNTMAEIPVDYYEVMGVPITSFDKLNEYGYINFVDSDRNDILFEIVGQLNGGVNQENYDFAKPILNGKCKFKRLVVKRVKK